VEIAGIKTATGHQICCHTTSQNVIWSTIQLCIHISENNVLHPRQHLFPEFYLFIYFFFLISSWWHHGDIIAIFSLLHCILRCIAYSFQLCR